MRCNKCRCHSCSCDLGVVIKSIAAPTFTEDLFKFATENELFEGTIEEFLQFMKGPQGDDVYTWAVKNGFTTLTKEQWYQEIINNSPEQLTQAFEALSSSQLARIKTVLGIV